MSERYWQAKIWGLLHDPALKTLDRHKDDLWTKLEITKGVEPFNKSENKLQQWIADAALITAASDRSAIGNLSTTINCTNEQPTEISHLLSGAKIANWTLKQPQQDLFPDWLKQETNYRKVFWWLWRCLPEAACKSCNDESLILMPAETRIPDSSVWSHTNLTAALAGALAGYNLTENDDKRSQPHLVSFSFAPVQELIKASRKIRDFWAGSWLLHYLCAKVCWDLAQIYGPDTLLYPSLFQQPLIDYWLTRKWHDFDIKQPGDRQLLTAGFPNVLVLVLPADCVNAAMQTARQSLKNEWKRLGKETLTFLQAQQWMPGLNENSSTWSSWLEAQWQIYWSSIPIGANQSSPVTLKSSQADQAWIDIQNTAYNLPEQKKLFATKELAFLQATSISTNTSVNIGSWWSFIFDRTRFALAATKNARSWQIPTAFGPRSTISGLGPAVHPDNHANLQDWVTEGDTASLWEQQVGLFDGIEELNATEVVKRVLPRILSQSILPHLQTKWREVTSYPDLSSGVAGWLKQMSAAGNNEIVNYYLDACKDISDRFTWTTNEEYAPANLPWGIPWIKQNHPDWLNPRLLNAGWLIDDFQPNFPHTHTEKQAQRNLELTRVKEQIAQWFAPGDNPTDWYALAAGDGDGMSNWLKGTKLTAYEDYIASDLTTKLQQNPEESAQVKKTFTDFIQQQKRMGPSTHSALSRALLDFSNQLVPYLTEERYAGRLIYGGGDDVLAYTNLWEWDKWLWDIRQCFRGAVDERGEFNNEGDYWQWNQASKQPDYLHNRPLFTMGRKATISFGIVIAHHSVPLAIALENLYSAEAGAKEHYCDKVEPPFSKEKNAVQVRVIYSNGNILQATCKFEVFNKWQQLLNFNNSATFEQAAQMWQQHPAPIYEAITPWSKAFCDRRDLLKTDSNFPQQLTDFISTLYQNTAEKQFYPEVQNWLKLAAFIVRSREINIRGFQ